MDPIGVGHGYPAVMVRMGREVIRSWGFRPLEPGESITATFDRLEVLSIQGPRFEAGAVQISRGTVGTTSYTLAIGQSINAVSLAVSGREWCPDETDWVGRRNALPPYALIRLSRTQPFTCTSGWVRDLDEQTIEVHEAFDDAILAGRKLRDECLPLLGAALACIFTSEQTKTPVRHVQASTVGTTSTGKVVELRKVTADSPELIIPTPMAPIELSNRLDESRRLTAELDPKVATFLWMGVGEHDPLKKFLFLFLAIEIETHRAFKAASPSPVDQEKHKTIRPRFKWCVGRVWPHLTQSDVDLFEILLRARNDLAHGEVEEISMSTARSAEALSKKLHQARVTA